MLTDETKSRIAPPNGLVFNIPINDVYDMTNKYEIIDVILNEVNKFNNAVSIQDKKLGYMYFLIGLSECCTRMFRCTYMDSIFIRS